ncbi:Putative cobalt ABC transporter, ATP-binding protein [Loigolactobacillus coryniformis subsp. coryniformis CECT 5711]|uniref:Putative cobalt ABC transporter, ATP-binding protein n=2 Tax=Loigolactobacillus coryniformis TaxID=1610 RepID=J2ZQU4_9LACO|nr:Putative cobalt ABC transporter, ATP-binding protein [Loigolactobacillus coryniformis subsp. coryniformis CECT 5711]
MMLNLQHISYAYPTGTGLTDIELQINAGEFICFMGPNGSGKSTLFNLLSGLKTATAGHYYFNQTLIDAAYLKNAQQRQAFHQQIGFVFQNSDVQLFNLTVADEVAFGLRQLPLAPDVIEQRVNDCLALTGCTDLRDRVPYHLSGGEKKRVALASVLALNPSVLILDEPLNGLTPAAQQQILDLLTQLQQAGKTILLASHDYAQIKNIAQRFIVFNEQHQIVYDMDRASLASQPQLQAELALL